MLKEETLKYEDFTQDEIDKLVSNLISTRKKKRITQCELSEMTGIPQPTISRMESYNAVPKLHVLIRMAHALGLSLTLKEDDEEGLGRNAN